MNWRVQLGKELSGSIVLPGQLEASLGYYARTHFC